MASEQEWLAALRKCQNIACSSTSDDLVISQELHHLLELLKGDTLTMKSKQQLENFLSNILCNADLNWISHILAEMEANQSTILIKIFLQSPPDNTLISLISSINRLRMGARQSLCIQILESYFKQDRFSALLLNECMLNSSTPHITSALSSKLIGLLSSLPDRIANNTNGKFSAIFHHEEFFKVLAIQTIEVIEQLVEKVRLNIGISVKFLSDLLGQFCFCGKAESFLSTLLSFLVPKTKDDFIWRKITNKILTSLPERCLDVTVTQMAKTIPWYGCMDWIFSDSILHNSKLKFLLLHKLILIKHFADSNILQNIIGYISTNKKTNHLLLETLKKLLSVWADTSAIRHVSYEQHRYVTQAILICIGHLTKELCVKHQQDLTLCMMPGISSHIDCTDVSIRRLGMIVGEALSAKLDIKAQNKLEFEYIKDEETKSLMQLTTPERKPDDDYFNDLLTNFMKMKETVLRNINDKESNCNSVIETFTTSKSTFLKVISTNAASTDGGVGTSEKVQLKDSTSENEKEGKIPDFDSDDEEDDDLQPYDMSNNTLYSKVKKPIYIRDCMEGLLQSDDREKMEISLSSTKILIHQNPIAAKEVSVELCRILLLLDDTFALANFTQYRHSAMTSLAVVDPEKVAHYLTTEFYAENYSLQHRLDMLEVLTAAAGVLSSVERRSEKIEPGGGISRHPLNKEVPSTEVSESWREIVDKRIESKTRRFGKVKRNIILPKANQFGSVAGYFFYPLLAGYDKRVRTLDLLGTDSLVLGRLLYSVGTIVYSAMNTLAVSSMASTLLEFVLELRYHPETYVRQAALFCVSMAILSAGNTIASDDVMLEINDWISDVMSRDTSTRTRELATQTAMLINTAFKNHLK